MNKAILSSLALLAVMAVATPSFAGTIILYDDEKCGGANVTITADTPDLAAKDFSDKASSYMIKDGNWALYTGAGFTRSRLPSDEKNSLSAGACVDLAKPFDNNVKSIKSVQ